MQKCFHYNLSCMHACAHNEKLPVDRVGVTKFAGYTKAAELLQYRGEIKPGIDNLSTV